MIGNYSEVLAFTSNAANTSTPSLTLTGSGLISRAQHNAGADQSVRNDAFGQPATITATITSTHSGTPTGSVAFSVDGGQAKNVQLSGNTAKIVLTNLTGGSHSISAVYSGDLLFAPSNATLPIAVGRATSTVAITTSGGNQNPASATPGTLLQLIATITPGASTVPTGTVTFTLNGKQLAPPAAVSPTTTKTNGVTTTIYSATIFHIYPASWDRFGCCYLQRRCCNYASSSSTLPVTITPMTFTLSPSSAST